MVRHPGRGEDGVLRARQDGRALVTVWRRKLAALLLCAWAPACATSIDVPLDAQPKDEPELRKMVLQMLVDDPNIGNASVKSATISLPYKHEGQAGDNPLRYCIRTEPAVFLAPRCSAEVEIERLSNGETKISTTSRCDETLGVCLLPPRATRPFPELVEALNKGRPSAGGG